MKTKNTFRSSVLIDNDNVYMQIQHPFWLDSDGFAIVFEVIINIFFAILLYAAPIIGVLIFVILLVPDNYKLYVLYLMGFCLIFGVVVALSRKHVSYYDKKNRNFVIKNYYLWRKTSEYVWPIDLFDGVSYGHHFLERSGGNPGVRLHARHGRYVLNFMGGNKWHWSRELAEKLSEYSSLNNLGEIATGTQHNLDDLRNTLS